MLVNLGDGCVGHRIFHARLVTRNIEYPFEYIGLSPSTELSERTIPVAKFWRQVPPRGSGQAVRCGCVAVRKITTQSAGRGQNEKVDNRLAKPDNRLPRQVLGNFLN